MIANQTTDLLASQLVGSWSLLSRIDRAGDGTLREDPALGSDALGMLTYASNRFAAQFMKRDRSAGGASVTIPARGQNNTTAVGGYDAYFGTYQVLPDGDVVHHIEAALTPENIGLEVRRRLSVEGDRLTIVLQTKSFQGENITRTLLWHRIGGL